MFGGALLGETLSLSLAPGSTFASFVSFAMLPLAFVLGIHLWVGLALVKALWWLAGRFVQWIRRRHSVPGDARPSPVEPYVPPGSFVFVPVSVGLAGLAGVCVGLVSRVGFILTVSTYVFIGALYGASAWLLARAGYVDPSDLDGSTRV